MKIHRLIPSKLMLAAAVVGMAGLASCLKDDNNSYYLNLPNALVTVKPNADQSFFLQLDDSTTLLPVNMATSPYGEKEVRALVNYSPAPEQSPGAYSQAISINWIDSILTKPLAPDLGQENDEKYGTDPVDILDDWVTIAEDGYLTLGFRAPWGNSSQAHYVNLLYGTNPDKPYEVEFRHNAFGDTYGQPADGIVAFRLDKLPDTQGKTVKLTLKWRSPQGEKTADFDYCTRRATNPQAPALTSAGKRMLRLQ